MILNLYLSKFIELNKIVSFLFIFIYFNSFSQVENSNRKVELLPPMSSALKNLNTTPNNPNYFSILKKSETQKEKGKSVFESETFLDPADIYMKNIKKEKQKQNSGNYSKGDYLGDVITGAEYVNVICRDFEYVDLSIIKEIHGIHQTICR
jgi:hypothetical protein